MSEREVFERVVAVYQTYYAWGAARYRTAVVWSRPEGFDLDGERVGDPFLVWTISADSDGTASDVQPRATERDARAFAQEWLGADREVPIEKAPYSALNAVFTDVTGSPLR